MARWYSKIWNLRAVYSWTTSPWLMQWAPLRWAQMYVGFECKLILLEDRRAAFRQWTCCWRRDSSAFRSHNATTSRRTLLDLRPIVCVWGEFIPFFTRISLIIPSDGVAWRKPSLTYSVYSPLHPAIGRDRSGLHAASADDRTWLHTPSRTHIYRPSSLCDGTSQMLRPFLARTFKKCRPGCMFLSALFSSSKTTVFLGGRLAKRKVWRLTYRGDSCKIRSVSTWRRRKLGTEDHKMCAYRMIICQRYIETRI